MEAQQRTVGRIEAHRNPNCQLDGPEATRSAAPGVATGARTVLIVLAAAQLLMTLDSLDMNVSIVYVANDLGTTVTGVQTAITLYTLMMASLMITGSRIGALIGWSVAVGDFLHTVLNEVPGWASTIAADATAT